MIDYKDKKIVVVGLGLTGLSCIDFFMKRGIAPSIIDTRMSPPRLNELPRNIEYHLGVLNYNFLRKVDLIVKSPGISLTHPILTAAIDAGVEIVGDIELFCREVRAPVIAITGSNGKSTVTSLIGEIAKKEGVNVGIGGNIGLPALMLLNSSIEMYVLELSSFQLETTTSLRAVAATVLNVTQDHMDRYPLGLQQYRAAKLRIYNNAKNCIVNADDMLTTPLYNTNTHFLNFGINVGDYHLNYHADETWLCVKGEKLLNVREMKIIGQHNYINALATLALADAVGFQRTSSLKALISFRGLPHRFQLVLERNGVRWINDSKSTNIGSTKAALDNLHINGTLHLLLGGDEKSADLSSLKCYLSGNNLRLYCFGQNRDKLSTLRPEITEKTETMDQAMHLLASRVKPGDIVLLSPACSSLDQFENFEQRGEIFTRLAKELS